jgi:hypothetical protein
MDIKIMISTFHNSHAYASVNLYTVKVQKNIKYVIMTFYRMQQKFVYHILKLLHLAYVGRVLYKMTSVSKYS